MPVLHIVLAQHTLNDNNDNEFDDPTSYKEDVDCDECNDDVDSDEGYDDDDYDGGNDGGMIGDHVL